MPTKKSGTVKETNPIDAYRKRKLRILKRDFRITLSQEDLDHAETLKSETQIDQFVLAMLNKYWG